MIQLAQAIAEAVDPARAFGLTIPEWVILLGALAAFLEALRQRRGRIRNGEKVKVVVEAWEEIQEAHPEAVRLAKRIIRDKATKLGIETSKLGLEGLSDDVKKHTGKLKKDVLLVLVACALFLGCVSPAAIQQCVDQLKFNTYHWNNETLPMESRLIAVKNADAWAAQRYTLDGTKLPKDVEDRLREQDRLPKDYK